MIYATLICGMNLDTYPIVFKVSAVRTLMSHFFQASLKSAQDHSTAEFLTASDRALLWLCYIHLTEFDQLPASLYDPPESGPGRLVCTKSFQLPWRTQDDISTPPDILIALFKGLRWQRRITAAQTQT